LKTWKNRPLNLLKSIKEYRHENNFTTLPGVSFSALARGYEAFAKNYAAIKVYKW
jgi:hypothetical protein